MAKKKDTATSVTKSDDEFTGSLIKSINTTLKETRAFNLHSDANPTEEKRFISTRSTLLDYIISNRRDGGIAEGRLTVIQGQESTGKTLIALQILAETQKVGGVAVYLDTENATDTTLLQALGINLKTLVYTQPKYVEEVFEIIEHIIK